MILTVLIALVARAAASPARAVSIAPDARAEAIRYANALTGVDPDDDDGDDDDGDDDDGDDDADRDDGEDGDVTHEVRDCSADDCDDGDASESDVDRGGWRDERARFGAGDSLASGGGDDREGDDDDDDDGGTAADDEGARLDGLLAEDSDGQDGAAVSAAAIAGDLAALDAGAADPGTAAGDDVSFAAASAGAAETYESWMRHQRPSRWGRVDLGVEWRRRWSQPMQAMSRRYDEVWLVATWRR